MKERSVTYLLRNVPEGTYREVQRIAKKRGLTLRTQLLLAMEKIVEEEYVDAPKTEGK